MSKQKSSYAAAGVNIDTMMSALSNARRLIKQTNTPGVISDVGSFGGLFQAPGTDHLLVSSVDGVGTKLNVAAMANRHDTVGQDLVNHCVNDILVQGARPLFFMDYLGTSTLDPMLFKDVVKGLCKACIANGCALLGGETAEMPGLYPKKEYDLVGAIIGSVPRDRVITGEKIEPGDAVLGLPSSGLHTNGYSLARNIIFKKAKLSLNDLLPGTRRTVESLLLSIHRSYLKPVMALMEKVEITGMAHITGGGIIDNLPRVLPHNTNAVIDTSRWKVPPLFQFLQERGAVDEEEMFRVFNMGLGMTIMVRQEQADTALQELKRHQAGCKMVGYIETGEKKVRLLL